MSSHTRASTPWNISKAALMRHCVSIHHFQSYFDDALVTTKYQTLISSWRKALLFSFQQSLCREMQIFTTIHCNSNLKDSSTLQMEMAMQMEFSICHSAMDHVSLWELTRWIVTIFSIIGHCIGERMAKIQTKIGLACILSKYNLEFNDKSQLMDPPEFLKTQFFLRSAEPFNFRVVERSRLE